MNIQNFRKEVEASKEYEKYKKEHPDAYLVHLFVTMKGDKQEQQLGYFDPENGNVASFTPERMTGDDKPLQKEAKKIPELETENVTVSLDDALAAIEGEKALQGKSMTQKICILGQGPDGPFWNLTLVTDAFGLINAKVSATECKVLECKEHSLMSLGKVMPGAKGRK